jgi:hydrogenase/urease accessory protein HupE
MKAMPGLAARLQGVLKRLRRLGSIPLTLPLTIPLMALTLWLGSVPPAQAHEMTMVDLTVREIGSGDFVWAWGVPGKGRPVSEDLGLHWPEQCRTEGQTLRCGTQGLQGTLSIDGVGKAYSAVILRLNWRAGPAQTITLTGAQPSARLLGGATDTRGAWVIASTYAVLGVEHILSGWDHLLFVIGLLLLVGYTRRLVATVTAFTVAHSLTLGLSAMGWLTLRAPPVEAAIALSIVLVCSEAVSQKDSLTRRWPAAVAFAFGLVHGLGFAGALREIGLPEQHFFVALLTFNLGVEAGQLLVLLLSGLLALISSRGLGRWLGSGAAVQARGGAIAMARRMLVYAIGTVAVYWSIERLAQMMWQ